MHTELVSVFGDQRRLCLTLCYNLTKIAKGRQVIVGNDDIKQLWLSTLHFLDQDGKQLPKKLKGHKLQLILLLRFLGTHLTCPTFISKELRNNLNFYLRPILLNDFEYFGFENGWIKNIGLSKITMKILPKRRYAPAPYIGVGYRDKGNTKNSALDGMSFTTLMKATQLKEEMISFYETDFNSSFDIQSTCSTVDDDIEDILLDY